VNWMNTTGLNATALRIKAHGLKGGHSGVDIHEGRANANKCLIRILGMGFRAESVKDVYLAEYNGGSKRNAVPREAEAVVVVDNAAVGAFKNGATAEAENIKLEFKSIDPDFQLDITEEALPGKVLDSETSLGALRMLNAVPHGVYAMSLDIPELVETSTNCAVINLEEDYLRVWVSTRSSIKSALEWGRSIHDAVGKLAGAEMDHWDSYPGWKPNLDSRILKVVKDVHTELFGAEPEMKAIHAGLECGLIIEKFPGMDAVSIGPQIEHPHSPTERVNIPSVEKFYTYVTGVLEKLTQG